VTGTATARVGVLEFSEFQCPFCGLFARDTLPELSERYVKAGKVLVGFRHFPLREIHPLADQAARAAECGRKGGKFWEMHDALFSDPARLNIEQLIALGTSLQLGPTFEACLAAKSDQVERDTALGLKLGVTSTPTFFLGRIGEDGLLHVSDRIVGAQRAAQFAVIIDKLLRG
jgi:protein-disulfide isomerase